MRRLMLSFAEIAQWVEEFVWHIIEMCDEADLNQTGYKLMGLVDEEQYETNIFHEIWKHDKKGNKLWNALLKKPAMDVIHMVAHVQGD